MPRTYDRLRETLARLPAEMRKAFEGFGDMDLERLDAVTGLGPEA